MMPCATHIEPNLIWNWAAHFETNLRPNWAARLGPDHNPLTKTDGLKSVNTVWATLGARCGPNWGHTRFATRVH